MDTRTFLENFSLIADAPNGIPQIRKVCLALLIRKAANAPDSRQGVSIKEICQVDWGDTSKTKTSYVDGGKFLAVSAAGPDGRIDTASSKALTPVLSAIGAQCGRMFMPTEDFTAIKNTMVINPNESLIRPWFLYYLFTSETLPKRGSAQPFMTKGDVQAFEIVLPSIPSQDHAITQIIQLMALCDELESAKAMQETLRTAARASAIDAISSATTPEELSTAWSRISDNWIAISDSLNAVGSLQKLIYQLAFKGYFVGNGKTQNSSVEGWHKALVGEILTLEYGKPLDKTLRKETGKVPVYGANGIKCFTDQQYVDGPGIVVGRKGSAGEVNLTHGAYWPLDVTYFVVHDPGETNLMYLYHLLKHLDLTKLAHGIKPGINRNEVYRIPVLVPPISEQQLIVNKIEELMKLCHELEACLNNRTQIESAISFASSQLLAV